MSLMTRSALVAMMPYPPGVADLAPDGWWRASYAGSPWTPTASAGTSGSNGNLVTLTAVPAVGSTVNGFAPATFSAGHYLQSGSNSTTFVTETDLTAVSFFKMSAYFIGADNGYFYACPPLLSDATNPGTWGLVASNGSGYGAVQGIRAGIRDDTGTAGQVQNDTNIALATGVWAMAAMRYSSTGAQAKKVKCRVSQASGTTDTISTELVAIPGHPTFSGKLIIGPSLSNANDLEADVLETLVWKRSLTDAELVNLRDYFNYRYAQSLT